MAIEWTCIKSDINFFSSPRKTWEKKYKHGYDVHKDKFSGKSFSKVRKVRNTQQNICFYDLGLLTRKMKLRQVL